MKNRNVRCVLVFWMMLLGTSLWAQSTKPEERRVTLRMSDVTTEQLFKAIHEKTGLSFIYNVKDLEMGKIPEVRAKNERVKSLLLRRQRQPPPYRYHYYRIPWIAKRRHFPEELPTPWRKSFHKKLPNRYRT